MNDDWVLLPMPRRVQRLEGSLPLAPDRFIWLEGGEPGALLSTGRAVQEALGGVGARWELTAARGDDTSRLGAVVHVDPAQVAHPEGYQLTIVEGQIRIVAHDLAGAFYGAMTLRQLARQFPGTAALPRVHIEDWPDFPNRGVMMDVTREKVPTMATLYALVDQLAEWKLNQLQLYTEYAFAYRDHQEVWEDASPMTAEQILALDAYCRERHIELVPNQNTFGHLTRWLRLPRYNHLAEAPDGFDYAWGGHSDQPFSLCPEDPGSIEFVRALLAELLPNFSSRQVNVGADETFDVGQGRSKQAVAERGAGRVYMDFLLKIHDAVQRQGRTMQFWGDIIMHHPELIPELPEGIVALEWGYEANHPFAKDGEKFAQAGVPFYVCPGTSSWNTIAGRTENAVANLRNAAENGRAAGAIGYLITDWGDNGHWQHLPISFLGYAYGAALSWAVDANRDLDLTRALDTQVFRDSAGVMGRLAYDLGNAYRETGVLVGNASALNLLLLRPAQSLTEGSLSGLTVEALEKTQAYLDGVMAPLDRANMDRPDGAQIAAEFRSAASMLRHACRLGIGRLEAEGNAIANIPAETRRALAEELAGILTEYRRLWLERNRPGGLPDSAGRLERLLALYRG